VSSWCAYRRGRTRGKSDQLDALAMARAVLQEPQLDGPRVGEEPLRELRLLVDHRDDLVDERRRAQQRLRWQLHELDPTLRVPLGALDRAIWIERLARQLAGREQTIQVRIARDLLSRCRTLGHAIGELDRELRARTTTIAPAPLQPPGCGPLSAAKLLGEIGPIERFRSDAQLARHAGVAPLDASSGKHQRHRLDCGGNRQLTWPLHRIARTQGRLHAPAHAYLERTQAEGKSRREAIRCLKRQLARTVHTTSKAEPALTQEQRSHGAASRPSKKAAALVGTTRARGAQALGVRPLSKGELGWQRGARCNRGGDALGHRRAVLEAMARPASHDPYAWLGRVWSCDEVRVRRDLVSA
jgi:transposase